MDSSPHARDSSNREGQLTPSPPFGMMGSMDENQKQFGPSFWTALAVILAAFYLLALPEIQ